MLQNSAHRGCPTGEPGEEGTPSTDGIPEEWLQGLHENIAERYPSSFLESNRGID